MERGVVTTLHFACWYFIPNPENSKLPGLAVESFFGGTPLRALWFYATAMTAVTMFCTFSLAVTAVTVVTCIYEFMGDSLCTYAATRRKTQYMPQKVRGLFGERRRSGMTEPWRLRRGSGYAACADEAHGTLQPSG